MADRVRRLKSALMQQKHVRYVGKNKKYHNRTKDGQPLQETKRDESLWLFYLISRTRQRISPKKILELGTRTLKYIGGNEILRLLFHWSQRPPLNDALFFEIFVANFDLPWLKWTTLFYLRANDTKKINKASSAKVGHDGEAHMLLPKIIMWRKAVRQVLAHLLI